MPQPGGLGLLGTLNSPWIPCMREIQKTQTQIQIQGVPEKTKKNWTRDHALHLLADIAHRSRAEIKYQQKNDYKGNLYHIPF